MTAQPLHIAFDATHCNVGGRSRGRLRRGDGRMSQEGWAAEEAPVQVMVRRRLDDGAVCGAEALAAGRMAAGALLGRIGGLAGLVEEYGRLAIGLGGGDFPVARLAAQFGAALDDTAVAAERVELVLPEAALVELDEDGVLALAVLRDAGVELVLDGFGAGLASLTMLRRLPLSAVKLARTVVRGLPDDSEDAAMARAAIGIAHAMGLTVIADGIETEAQRGLLAFWGCDEGQGPLFGSGQ